MPRHSKVERGQTFALRLPKDLREWVERQATNKDRSLNWVVTDAVAAAKAQQDGGQQTQRS